MVWRGIHEDYGDGDHRYGVDCRPEEECDEVRMIPISDTSANPRTVMIMNLYANSTLRAMERPGRPQNITSGAITELVLLFLSVNVACSVVEILIVDHW